MATPPASYVPWRRIKDAIGGWALSALELPEEGPASEAGVLWADQGEERPELPYLELLVVSGPTRRGQDQRRQPALALSTQVVKVLPQAVEAPGAPLRLRVSGELFERRAEAGDSVGDARDALVALVEASVELGASAAPQGADEVLLTSARTGSLWGVEAYVGCELGASAHELAELVVGRRELRVRATCYGAPDADDPSPSPAEWMGMLQDAMVLSAPVARLQNQGLVLVRIDALQLRPSADSGPERETRAAMEMTFAFSVVRGVPMEQWLDGADVTVRVVS